MKYLIVDDEPIAHRIIEEYCKELDYLQKVGNAYDVFKASQIIANQSVELVFLDLSMPKMTGFEWLRTLNQYPLVIVTTAYREHALEGYEFSIVDYLVKPFSFSRFFKAINKAMDSEKFIQPTRSIQSEVMTDSIFLKVDKKYHQIHIMDILFIEAYGNYVKIFLQNEIIVARETMNTLESKLIKHNFFRVHKSFLVAKNKIKFVEGNRIYIEAHQIPIGQSYRSKLNKLWF